MVSQVWNKHSMNKILQGDCLEVMKSFEEGCIDLTVTSPPYDNLRDYKGYTFDFEGIARELYRVTKEGGVVVWVVGDATIKGSETGTSFKQALYFKEIGFKLHDTMIYQKAGTGACGSNSAYWQSFEYMFILSKDKPNKVNRIADQSNKRAGAKVNRGRLSKSGIIKDAKRRIVPAFSVRTNIWRYQSSNGNDRTKHPAQFPEQLAEDHILSWSNEGDTVLDPFAGSGTTLKMAKKNNRGYIGIEISPEYIEIIKQRLPSPSPHTASMR